MSIPAVNYDLGFQLEPTPEQTISLSVVNESGQELSEDQKNNIRKDDVIYLRTSVIVDRNGNPVPNGTPVQFILTYPQEDRVRTIDAETVMGVASISLSLDRVGQLDVAVRSVSVPPFYHLQLTIREGQSVVILSVTPTPEPENPVQNGAERNTEADALPNPLRLPTPKRHLLLVWGIAGGLCVGMLGFLWGWEEWRGLEDALRIGLWGVIGGLGGYTFVIAGMRWFFRGWFYALAGREGWAGGWTLLAGGGLLAAIFGWGRYRSRPEEG